MILSPPPLREVDLTSSPWQQWFSSIKSLLSDVSDTRIKKGVDTQDDVIIANSSKGIVLEDSNANYWRVSISTTGVLTTTNLGATKP
jgi:hypothetical protein